MRTNKSNLDEFQEQELLKIEHNVCWIAFWGLFASMVIQIVMYGYEDGFKTVAAEWTLFMAICIYMGIACMRKGIWDRRLKANTLTNLVVSLVAALFTVIITVIIKLRSFPDKQVGCIVVGLIVGAFVFVLVFAGLEISRVSYKKRLAKLESEPEEAEE